MNELQRMSYLDAMGLECFVPRLVLPCAKPSVRCELPAIDENDLVVDHVEPIHEDTSSPAPVSVVAERLVEQIRQDTSARNDDPSILQKRGTELVTADQPETKPEPVRFSLSLWRVSPDLLVMDTRRQGDALPTHSLLNNIVHAMSLAKTALPNAEIINWPLVENADDNSWAAASEMVQGFLDGKLLAQPVRYMLLFGEAACLSVLGQDFNVNDKRGQWLANSDFSCQLVCLPSLAELLYEPQLKKVVWQALCDLPNAAN